jgi:type IV fimbrial biogenesis protein FimT
MNINLKPIKCTRNELGFTLVELMTTLSIAAILTFTAAPYVGQMVQSNALTSQSNEMVAILNFARSEAIRRNSVVKLCRADTEVIDTCSNNLGQWKYWLVLDNTAVLKRGIVPGLGSIEQTSNFYLDMLSFKPDGLVYSNNALANGKKLQLKAENNYRCILLGAGSRISITKATTNCI